MKATELRIGNYYQYASHSGITYTQVQEIKRNQFGLLSDFDGTNFEICKPIQLTEEWLMKFGFENIDTNVNGGDNFWCLSRPDFILNRSFQSFQMNTGVDLEHVHQLQNLYFALTGEELIIK